MNTERDIGICPLTFGFYKEDTGMSSHKGPPSRRNNFKLKYYRCAGEKCAWFDKEENKCCIVILSQKRESKRM